MSEMSEREICDKVYDWIKEGQVARRCGGSVPYRGGSFAAMCWGEGWLLEDLRMLAMRSHAAYGEEQRRYERNGVFGDRYKGVLA